MPTIELNSPTINEKGEIVAQNAEQFTEDLGNGIQLDMIVIPSGIFQMGSFPHHGNHEEQPRHLVTIKSFMLGKFLITQEQWKAIMGKNRRADLKGANFPLKEYHGWVHKNSAKNYQTKQDETITCPVNCNGNMPAALELKRH